MNSIKAAWAALLQALTPSKEAWSSAAGALLGLWVALFAAFALGMVLPHFSIEKLAGLVVLFAFLALVSAGLLLVVKLLAASQPQYRRVLLLVLAPTLLVAMLDWGPKGAVIGSAIILAGVSLLFGSIAALRRRAQPRRQRIGAAGFLVLGAVLLGVFGLGMAYTAPDPNPSLARYHLAGHTLGLPDPGQPGPYKVAAFTYGGGKDRWRTEYAKGARFITRPVDGSKLDERWTGIGGAVRTHYWGFSPAAFPVQGRVWMPDTRQPGAPKGPFPLVLMVHGNHEMEDFSDPGYAYLGQHLASQGFIFVSVDENFLNSSLADFVNPLGMRRGRENNARGWMMLENLAQWRAWSVDKTHPLYGKIDMDRIALIGHSRGGDAVALANAFNDLDRDPDDATIPFNFHFHLKAIAAIAPVDGQYQPRARPTPMRDINYFVLHGSMDGDMTSFSGSQLYSRASFSGAVAAFKASLYIKGANHGQFNTAWGRDDSGLPFPWLDKTPIMDPLAQRRIATVYLTAFLQATLNGKDGYRPLFQDARNGAGWLPNDYLMNNYADSTTTWLANYEEDIDPATGTAPGSRITAQNLSIWYERYIDLKWGQLNTQVAVLGWDARVFKAPASYTIDLGAAPPTTSADTDLVFSAADAGIGSLPKTYHGAFKGGRKDDRIPLDWTIVVTDAAGAQARLPLSHDQLLYPQIKGETRHLNGLNDTASSEVVMRRYRFALKDFAAVNPKLDLSHLRSVRFDFDTTLHGAIALDDVGLARE